MDALWIRGPLDWTRTAKNTCREARGDDDQAYQKYLQEGQGVDDSGQDYQMYMQEGQGDDVDAARVPRGCLADGSWMPRGCLFVEEARATTTRAARSTRGRSEQRSFRWRQSQLFTVEFMRAMLNCDFFA